MLKFFDCSKKDERPTYDVNNNNANNPVNLDRTCTFNSAHAAYSLYGVSMLLLGTSIIVFASTDRVVTPSITTILSVFACIYGSIKHHEHCTSPPVDEDEEHAALEEDWLLKPKS